MSENHHLPPYSQEQETYIVNNQIPYVASTSQPSLDSPSENALPPSPTTPQPITITTIDQLAATYQLGHVQKVLKNDASKHLTSGLSSLFIGFLFFLPLILSVLSNGGYLAGMRWTFLMGIGFLSYGINRTTLAINNGTTNIFRRNTCYYLCRYGLLRVKGKQAQGLRWDQVSAIQKILAADGISLHQYVLYPSNDQEPFILERYNNTSKALDLQIEHEIAQHLLPKSIAAYTAGQTLDFGAFDITPQGLYLKAEEKNLSWEEIKTINECRDTLTIMRKQPLTTWAIIDTSTLLNLCILFPLIKHIQSISTKESIQKPLSSQPPLNLQAQSSEWGEYE